MKSKLKTNLAVKGWLVRDPARIDGVLAAIRELWVKYPDMRLCQLMWGASNLDDPFFLEDDELVKRLGLAADKWEGKR